MGVLMSQLGSGAAREKINEIKSLIWTFFLTQSFSPVIFFLEFWSLGYPRFRGSGWRDHTCVKNLSWVGVEVCAKFGRIGQLVPNILCYTKFFLPWSAKVLKLGVPGVWVCRVILVLRTYLELVQRFLPNLAEIGPAVTFWKDNAKEIYSPQPEGLVSPFT